MASLKILFVSNVVPQLSSGAAGTDVQTVRALRELGHEVDAIWHDDLGITIRHSSLSSVVELPIAMASAIDRWTRKKQYDVICVNQPFAWLAAKRNKKLDSPAIFIIRSHGFETHAQEVLKYWSKKLVFGSRPKWKVPFSNALDMVVGYYCKLAAKYSDGFIVSSQADQRHIVERLHVAKDRVACVPQAAPQAFLDLPPEPFSSDRNSRILFIGPAALWKGAPIIFQAITEVLRANPAARFTWVCGEAEHQLNRKGFAIGVRDRVELLPNCNQAELMQVYDANGIFIFPSLFEGFGKSALEAMARGLCVVATKVGGMADLFSNMDDSILINPGSVDELVAAINLLVYDNGLATHISQNARITASKYTWRRTATGIDAYFRQLV